VRTHQRKARLRVIELRICPQHRIVALFAGCWEPGMRHRRRSVIEVLLVARNTSRHRDAVVIVGVAIRARPRRYRVRAGQRKVGLGVVKRRWRPAGIRGMARFAILRKARACVIRILGVCKIRHVAGHARGSAEVVIPFVALLAGYWWRGVPQSQQEAGRRVVKLRIHPVIGRVALLAGRLECRSASNVVRIRGGPELLHVA